MVPQERVLGALPKNQVSFPAPTWELTVIYSSISTWLIHSSGLFGTQTFMQANTIHIKVIQLNDQKIFLKGTYQGLLNNKRKQKNRTFRTEQTM